MARSAVVAVSVLFAGFSIYYWAYPLWENGDKQLAVFVGLLFAVSAAVTPTVTPKIVHSKGAPLAGLLFVCVTFGAVDTVGVTGGFMGLDRDMSETQFQADLAEYNTEKSKLETELQEYKDEIKAQRAKFGANGEIRNASSLALVLEDLTTERDRVQGQVDALVEPKRIQRFSVELAGFLAGFLQIAFAVGLMCLEAARERKFREALAEYEAELDRQRQRRRRRKAPAKKKTQPTENVVHFPAND